MRMNARLNSSVPEQRYLVGDVAKLKLGHYKMPEYTVMSTAARQELRAARGCPPASVVGRMRPSRPPPAGTTFS